MDHLAVSTQKIIVGKYVELSHLDTNVVHFLFCICSWKNSYISTVLLFVMVVGR